MSDFEAFAPIQVSAISVTAPFTETLNAWAKCHKYTKKKSNSNTIFKNALNYFDWNQKRMRKIQMEI